MHLIIHIRENFMDAFLPRLSEWFPAAVLFFLGWSLSFNPTLMSDHGDLGYSFILSIASQSTWGLIMILCGACRLVVLLVNGWWRRSPWLRAGTAFISCFFWITFSMSFYSFSFAFVAYCGYLAMDYTNIVRAMRDARTVDDAFAKAESDQNGYDDQ